MQKNFYNTIVAALNLKMSDMFILQASCGIYNCYEADLERRQKSASNSLL